MSRARSLILAHLALAGCKRTEPPDPKPEPTATATATAVATATATPVTPSVTASAEPTPSSSVKSTPTISLTITSTLPPGRCRSKNDCTSGAMCEPSGNATELGYCRSHVIRGRPLVVDGESRVAALDGHDALSRAALEEHASIAAFARTICTLMSLGAPSWLLRETSDALADEVRHAEMTLDAIERATGERPVIGELPHATAPLEQHEDEFFRDVFRGGAIGETLAAAHAEREAELDPAMRSLYETILVDEARHAALAIKTLRWLLDRNPDLARVRDEEIARFAHAPLEERALVTPLFEALA